jgi:hypothetical protein
MIMEKTETKAPICRVTDLIASQETGADVSCRIAFEIIPVDFQHRANPFQAYVFLAHYTGEIDGSEYRFRKCYARGCPHNLCPHVSQAVMIANRHLQRDYRRMENAGIPFEKNLFSLPEMMIKYEEVHPDADPAMSMADYIRMAREGTVVSAEPRLELVPAVEHFAGHQKAQMFLMAAFTMTTPEKSEVIERCLACYPKSEEGNEKAEKTGVANQRLKLLYEEFNRASIRYESKYF